MSERTLKVPAPVRELVRHLPPEMKKKVRDALADVLADPGCGKPLQRELDGYWSLRLGRLRIIYRPDGAGSEIVAIGPRKTIYEDMARQVMSERARGRLRASSRRRLGRERTPRRAPDATEH